VAVTGFLAGPAQKYTHRTYLNYASVLRRFSRDLGPNKRVGYVTDAQVEEWITGFIDRGRAPGTVNRYRGDLTTFNRWCITQGFTRSEWLASMPTEPDPERDWTQLTADQLLRLLDAAPHPRDRCMVALAMNTGLRINEITKLRVKDVDLNKNRLRTVISKQKARRETIDYMPITLELRDELITWLAAYEIEAGTLKDHWYLTPSKRRDYILRGDGPGPKTRRYTKSGDLKPEDLVREPQPIIRRVYTLAGMNVPSGEGWHTLRRSVALIYFHSCMDGGDAYPAALQQTSALLHHKSMLTTERYLGLNASRQARDAGLAGKSFLTRLASVSHEGLARRIG
jgi:integrase